MKLECLATFTLHDTVCTVASVALHSARDSLMLGFKDAKLSVVEYDPQTHGLKTISLHFFEKPDIHVSAADLVLVQPLLMLYYVY